MTVNLHLFTFHPQIHQRNFICVLVSCLFVFLCKHFNNFWLVCFQNDATNLFKQTIYIYCKGDSGPRCHKNNQNVCTKIEPVKAGADAKVYRVCPAFVHKNMAQNEDHRIKDDRMENYNAFIGFISK